MFCSKCGAKNSDEAVFCQKCGARFDDEEETKIARPPVAETRHHDEKQIFSIRPTLVFIKIGYAAAIAGAFLLVASLIQFENLTGIKISSWISVLAGLSLLLIPAFFHLKRNFARYILTDSKVEIDEGFIAQKTRNVPLRTIQDVSISSTIPQRMLGFGNLIIENASDTEGRIILKNINKPKRYADILLKQMRLLDK